MDEHSKEEIKLAAMSFLRAAGRVSLICGKAVVEAFIILAKGLKIIVDDIANEVNKGTSQNAELEGPQNTWYSAAPPPVLFEAIYKQFATKRIAAPQYSWSRIQPVPAYLQIIFEASWRHESAAPNAWDNTTNVHMTLTITQLDDGGSAATVDYQSVSNNLANYDPFAKQLIKNTNTWIKAVCSQDFA